MIKRLAIVLSGLLSALGTAAQKVEDFEYGQRPPLAVFDPKGFLEPQTLKQISDPLAKVFKDEHIDVIVVILDDLGGAPPEHVARRFAAAWCDSPIHAVVLHVPGRDDSPWIVPAGKIVDTLKPEILEEKINEAKRDASREPDEQGKVRTASTEAADMLRYWMYNAVNRSVYLQSAVAEIRAEHEKKAKQWRIAMLTGVAAAIPVLIGLSMLVVMLRKPGPGRFPSTTPPRRLGAPHAGGNSAVADLGAPAP